MKTHVLLEAKNLTFSYRSPEPGAAETPILHGVSLAIRRGDFVAIQGPSGSGKSTLFYLLGCLMQPKSGQIYFDGVETTHMKSDERAYLRNEKIGFVFQQFHLLSRATVLENILLPARYPSERVDPEIARYTERARVLAQRFGLAPLLARHPNQLSGGQQQRVAIARALLKDVDLILADEPTGNLDSKSASAIMDELRELNGQGKTIVIITHDLEIAKQCSRSIFVRDGRLVDEPTGLEPLPGPEAEPTNHGKRSPSSPPLVRRLKRLLAAWPELRRTILSSLPLAWDNLWRNRVKSFLTMIGVIVGISAVLSMVTFSRYVERRILESFADLGANKITLNAWRNWRRSASKKPASEFREFSLQKDIEPLLKIFPDIIDYTPVIQVWGTSTVSFAGRTLTEDIRPIGTSTAYLRMSRHEVLLGTGLSEFQVTQRSPVCVVGFEIAKQLFQGRNNPLGEIIFLTSSNSASPFTCRIIGVLAQQSTNSDWLKPDFTILLPYTYLQTVLDFWNAQLNRIALETREGADAEKLSDAVKNFFKNKYGDSAEIYVGSDALMQAQIRKFLGLFSVLISSVALITLAVGGIGINNMMLVSVNERLKEIGLRKAIGATNRSIRVQLLTESTLLCGCAGLIGLVIGFTAYEAIIYFAAQFVSKLKFEWIVEPWAFAISLISIVAVGVLSGLTPALRAEKLEVIEALRSE
mgnify:CR=1 FL=1